MPNYQKTKRACYLGFITQAIAANFAPLLFLKFHTDYHISLGNIALISTCFFFTQLLIDLFCARFVDKIGYRVCIVTSEISSALGLVGLAFLPEPMALDSLAKQEVLQIAISEKLPLRHICLVHDHQHPLNSGARELKKIILGERMD